MAKEMTNEDISNLIDKIGDMAVADATHQEVMLAIAKAVGLIDDEATE